MKHRSKGFTIVELMVVIVVIAILAAITIVVYRGMKQRAQAAAIETGFVTTEKAMRLMIDAQDGNTWPLQSAFPDTYVAPYPPRIVWMIENTTLGQYLKNAPTTDFDAYWAYANDGSDGSNITNCTGTWHGPLLTTKDRNGDMGPIIDKQMDDGNPNCGKIRIDGQDIIYRLSNSQSLESS